MWVLIIMALVVLAIGLFSQQNSMYRSFFVIISVWLLFLSLNVERQELNTFENVNISMNVYNESGVKIRQDNSSRTNDPSTPTGVINLLDTANFVWLILALLITVLEVLNIFWSIINFVNGGKNGDTPLKPI